MMKKKKNGGKENKKKTKKNPLPPKIKVTPTKPLLKFGMWKQLVIWYMLQVTSKLRYDRGT